MNPKYCEIQFNTTGYDSEILMALLGEWDFESFHEQSARITAYILKDAISVELIEYLNSLDGQFHSGYVISDVAEKNWNAEWESSFNPVEVDQYCYIRATFHSLPTSTYKHVVTIAPKMAFGTGHHATTYMMLQAMSSLDFTSGSVFDFGCGTGILSVVAAMEGASKVIGVDIQPEAVENSIEHAEMNSVGDRCQFALGGIEAAEAGQYDIILANINLTVIQKHLESLKSMLAPGGFLLLSGIMTFDRDYMEQHLQFAPLKVLQIQEKGEWIQLTLQN